MNKPKRNGDISFWYADLGGLPPRRAPLDCDTHADVCIVGAGYTGLWAAYYLKQAEPELDILIVEKEFAGFGASGRNGGWLSGAFEWNHEAYAATGGADGVRRMVRAMAGTVEEVTRVADTEGIDADIHRCDELTVAVNAAQEARVREDIAHRRGWGEDGLSWIDAEAAAARIRVPGLRGAMLGHGSARVQPAKLVRGLAETVERMGVRIVEGTAVTGLEAGRVVTDRGDVRAGSVLRATEAYSAALPGLRRDWLPVNSAQVVTEPLPPEMWEQIGWHGQELFADGSNSFCYCQRTREGRIAVGSRGAPYRMGSKVDVNGEIDAATARRLVGILHRHFPATRDVGIAHVWCGVLGVPRDWCPTVGFDAETRIGWAGGYVGIGVSTSNLMGRTLRDLVLGRETELAGLPWVNRKVRRWEPEPLRWIGVRGMNRLLRMADRDEAKGGGPSVYAKLAGWIAGR